MSAEEKFRRFNFPKMIVSIVKGEDTKELYKTFNDDIKANYADNKNMKVLKYNNENKEIIGSNIFVVSRLSELLELSNIRTAIPSDDRYGDISRLVKDKFYTDFNALVLRTAGDSYSKNDKIAKDLAGKIENKQRKLKLPLMIVNPLVRYSKDSENAYGLVFNISKNTQIIEDERLDGKKYQSEMKFNEVDDLGLPFFDENGARTWYSREDGLCRLGLNWGLDLLSNDVDLALSNDLGRVVVVSDS